MIWVNAFIIANTSRCMYSVLFVSPDKAFLSQAKKILPGLDQDLIIIPAKDVSSAVHVMKEKNTVDAIVRSSRQQRPFLSLGQI